jgi:hypothetical protein
MGRHRFGGQNRTKKRQGTKRRRLTRFSTKKNASRASAIASSRSAAIASGRAAALAAGRAAAIAAGRAASIAAGRAAA